MKFRLHLSIILLWGLITTNCMSNYTNVYIDGSPSSPEEIQHAICKIAIEDIEASANATIVRELKGVCTIKEVLARLAELEQRLIEEIRMIKESEPKLKSLQIPVSTNKPKLAEKSHVGYSRDLEAVQNNQTIHMTELGKCFLHFWKVYDIVNILNYSESSIDSAMFYVQGNPLIITIHPRHLGTQYLALELSSSSWVPAHRFVILNQNNPKGDLSSQILGTKIPLFRIHADRISTSDFITDGSLIIKAIISYY
uniref:MATH domain-containing protein n=1 Tax=Photinus pyralis TaxID=7054 RepID=A0A1Y1ME76_PHOPY